MLLPGTSVRMKIGRPASTRLVEEYVAPQFAAGHKGAQAIVGVVAVVRELLDGREPGPDDLNPFGCVGRVFRCEKIVEDGETRYVLVIEGAEHAPKGVSWACRRIASPCPRLRSPDAWRGGWGAGLTRFRTAKFIQHVPFLKAQVAKLPEPGERAAHAVRPGRRQVPHSHTFGSWARVFADGATAYDRKDPEMEAQYAALRSATREMLDLLRDLKLPTGVLNQLRKYTEASPPGQLADLLTSAMDVSLKVRSTGEHRPARRSRAC